MRTVAFFVAFAAAGAVIANTQPPAQPSLVELVRRSGFIFQGTIKKVAASTPSVPTQPNTMIVVVDHVLEAFPPADNQRGREVTVRVQDPKHFYAHQRLTFFTFVYSAGKTLGLDAVGVLPISDPAALQNQIRQARRIIADEALANRLATAQTVVVGVIGGPMSTPLPPVSEHDPFWRTRLVQVESVEKGMAGTTANVDVSDSTDVMWERAPKPTSGQGGIFLLQPSSAAGNFPNRAGPFLFDPLDFLPRTELARVRRLLGSHH